MSNPNPAQAAKLIKIRIELDGNLILHGIYAAPDRADRDEIWDCLAGPRSWVKAVQDFSRDPSDPGKATLKGDIRIVVSWVERPIAWAKVDTLRVFRDPGGEGEWRIPREEVERTAKAAGLQIYKEPEPPEMPLIYSIFFGYILLFGLIILVALLQRGQMPKDKVEQGTLKEKKNSGETQ